MTVIAQSAATDHHQSLAHPHEMFRILFFGWHVDLWILALGMLVSVNKTYRKNLLVRFVNVGT